VRVLIVGVHPPIMKEALRRARAAGFEAHGELVADDPMGTLITDRWDVVAIGGGVAGSLRRQLHETAAGLDSPPTVIDIHGPGTLVARLRGVAD
jgi:hypothetical protein